MKNTITEKLLHQFRYCSNLMHRHKHHRPHGHDEHDLRGGQGKIIYILDEHAGITQKELADFLQIRPASVSELISKLEHRGYVQRIANESDKRITNVILTEIGKSIATQAKETRMQLSTQTFNMLSIDEQETLLSLLSKISHSLAQEQGQSGGMLHGRRKKGHGHHKHVAHDLRDQGSRREHHGDCNRSPESDRHERSIKHERHGRSEHGHREHHVDMSMALISEEAKVSD